MTNFFLLHERIIITVLVLATIVYGGNRYLDSRVVATTGKAVAAEQVEATQGDKNQVLATDVKDAMAQLVIAYAKAAASTQQLALAVATNAQATKQQQTVDATLPLADLGNRWGSLAGTKLGDIKIAPPGFVISESAARQTVVNLELVPGLQKTVADQKFELDGDAIVIDNGTHVINDYAAEVTGLNLQLADKDKACKAQVSEVVAKARKSKLRWFEGGFVVGFVAGLVAGHGI